MLVPGNPYFSSIKCLSSDSSIQASISELEKNYFLTDSGSSAIELFLHLVGRSEIATVIMPALICKSVPSAVVRAGCQVVFIDSDDDFLLSATSIKQGLIDAKNVAILLVDYFGFFGEKNLQVIRELRVEHSFWFIADRSHSFLSWVDNEYPDGPMVSIFSFRKTLPACNSGAFNVTNISPLPHHRKKNINSFHYRKLFEEVVLRWGLVNIYSLRSDWLRKFFARIKNLISFKLDYCSVDYVSLPAALLLQLSDKEYLDWVSQKRIENYNKLLTIFESFGLKSILGALPEGVVPQIFAILDSGGRLCALFRAHAIGAYQWPGSDLPEDILGNSKFPKANFYATSITCIPVHQSLTKLHFLHINDILSKNADMF